MHATRRSFILGAGATLAAGGLRGETQNVLQIGGPAFGAGWRVSVPVGADDEAGAAAIASAVADIVASVDQSASPFRAESEISAFNRIRSADWIPLSPATLQVIGEAKRVAAVTAGAFDPTLGAVVGRYGFGPITTPQAGSFRDLSLGDQGVRKADPAQTLDLCGIAKGHALDRIADALAALGHRDFFVELGGEVTAQGAHPAGRPWRAGIERPVAGATEIQHIVSIKGEALATSGATVNGYTYGDRRYSHIIDPDSRLPVETALASVSVFAPRAITADALATALFAMGSERGPAFAEGAEIPALFITRDAGSLRSWATHEFATRIVG
jgi:thiamine biosynthesis lipoprotein